MNIFSERWRQWRDNVDLDEYHQRWERLAADGESIHGEADFVCRYPGGRVLDAGCGMGRLGLELARRGRRVVGVDNDADMLGYARRDSESVGADIKWVCADLAAFSDSQPFDLIVAAGNVLVFVEPGDREKVVANMASLLVDGGTLITGATYGVEFSAGLALADFDQWCGAAGLELGERFATWEGDPFDGGDYAVSVHTKTAG